MLHKELGPPEMVRAAETIVNGRLVAAQRDHDGDHYGAFKSVMEEAGNDPALTGAIVFLYLTHALEAIRRAEATPH